MGTEDGDHPRPRPFGDGWDDSPDSAQSGLGMGSIPVPSWAPWGWEYYGGTQTEIISWRGDPQATPTKAAKPERT